MRHASLTLPGLEASRDARSLYGDPALVYVDALPNFSTAVVAGMRRELERLERAGIPAYADGRRIWTPRQSFMIEPTGQPSRWTTPVTDFEILAHQAVHHIARRNGFSFNQSFAQRYLQEDTTHA
jgi:hypothetical protein